MLQIYSQYDNHSEAFIVGDMEGLMTLRNALNDIIWRLKDDTSSLQECSDGEAYSLIISKKTSEQLHEKEIRLPYTSHTERYTNCGNSVHNLIKDLPEYKSLLKGNESPRIQ